MLLYYIYKSIIDKLHSELLLFTKWVFVTLFTKRDLDSIPSFIKIPLLKTAIISRPRLKFLTRQTRLLSPFFRAEVAPSRLVRRGGGPAFQRRWQRHGWGPRSQALEIRRQRRTHAFFVSRKHSVCTQWTGRAIFERKCLYNSVTHRWNSLRAVTRNSFFLSI